MSAFSETFVWWMFHNFNLHICVLMIPQLCLRWNSFNTMVDKMHCHQALNKFSSQFLKSWDLGGACFGQLQITCIFNKFQTRGFSMSVPYSSGTFALISYLLFSWVSISCFGNNIYSWNLYNTWHDQSKVWTNLSPLCFFIVFIIFNIVQ